MFHTIKIKNALKKQRLIYEKLFKKYGESLEALHWSSRETQEIRFDHLSRIGDLSGCSVLDVGCGLGDLHEFLIQKGLSVRVTGYDLIEELIQCCRMRFPDSVYEVRNILDQPPSESFDYVLASGLFAFGNQAFFEAMVKQCFALCRRGFGFNVHLASDPLFWSKPSQVVMDYCRTLKPHDICLIDGYMHHDYTVYLYKE